GGTRWPCPHANGCGASEVDPSRHDIAPRSTLDDVDARAQVRRGRRVSRVREDRESVVIGRAHDHAERPARAAASAHASTTPAMPTTIVTPPATERDPPGRATAATPPRS